jgi:hypothetical protein
MHLFDQGWNALRDQIFANQKKAGVIPQAAKLTPRPDNLLKKGTASTRRKKKLFIRQANAYAAYFAYTDNGIGRVIPAGEDNAGTPQPSNARGPTDRSRQGIRLQVAENHCNARPALLIRPAASRLGAPGIRPKHLCRPLLRAETSSELSRTAGSAARIRCMAPCVGYCP